MNHCDTYPPKDFRRRVLAGCTKIPGTPILEPLMMHTGRIEVCEAGYGHCAMYVAPMMCPGSVYMSTVNR